MLSIIIPVFNNHDMTLECITAIREHTQDFELVIIDNGSDPPFKPPFTGFAETVLIRNEENKGFPIAANQGIRAAKGDVIVLFNNDIICTPRWADRLVGWLDEFDIIAPMSNLVGGLQQVVISSYQSRDELDEAAEEFSEENKGLFLEVNFAVVSMFIKKKIFDDIGYLDESLWPCCGEDLDFCFRARDAGYRIGIAHDVYVHHEMSQTFKAMQDAGLTNYNEVVEQNNEHLTKKWGKDFWHKQHFKYWLNDSLPTRRNDNCQFGAVDGLRLNLGCGAYKLEGFVNIDQFENVEPDLVADVTNLLYEPNTVDEIYCGHLLEHLTWEEGQNALRHWLAILKPGGMIRIVVPNFDVIVKNYLDNPTTAAMKHLNDYFIYSYVQDSLHRYFYSAGLLKAAMAEAGFTNLERMPLDHPYYVEPVDWQVGYSGVKP